MKNLRSDASNATKEAFEKEVNFMSILIDRSVIYFRVINVDFNPFCTLAQCVWWYIHLVWKDYWISNIAVLSSSAWSPLLLISAVNVFSTHFQHCNPDNCRILTLVISIVSSVSCEFSYYNYADKFCSCCYTESIIGEVQVAVLYHGHLTGYLH